MASLEDYDEFGNYIGGDLESEDEDEETFQSGTQVQSATLEGYDEEPVPAEENAPMEVDGLFV